MMKAPAAMASPAVKIPLDGKSKLITCIRPVKTNQIPNKRKPKFFVTFMLYPPWVLPLGRIRITDLADCFVDGFIHRF